MDAGKKALRAESLRELDRRVMVALVRARAHLGLDSRAEFAELMDKATGGEGPDVSTYNKWENGSVRPPAWALVLAAEVASKASGDVITLSALLEEPATSDKPRPEYVARLARVEKQMDDLIGFVNAELERRRRQHHNPSSTEQVAGS